VYYKGTIEKQQKKKNQKIQIPRMKGEFQIHRVRYQTLK